MPVMPPDPDTAAALSETEVPAPGEGEGEGGGPKTLDEVVAEIDSAQAAELEAAKADDDEGEGEDESPTPRTKKATAQALHPSIQRFVDERYGGDVDAFVAGLYEQGNSLSALNKRIEELEASRRSPEQREAQVKELRESDEDYQNLNQDIQDLTAEQQALAEDQGALAKRAVTLDREIAILEGEMKRVEDVSEKAALNAELEAKKSIRQGLNGQYQKGERDKARLERSLNVARRNLSAREQALRSELDEQEEQAVEDQQFLESSKQWFRGAFAEEATSLGLKPGTPKYDKLYKAVKGELVTAMKNPKLERRPALTQSGIQDAVKHFFKETTEALGIAREKRAVALAPRRSTEMRPVTSRAINARPKASSTDAETDPVAVKDRARRIFRAALGG